MKKRYIAVLASAAALALMLTGCSGEKGSASSSADPAVSSGVTSTESSSQQEEPEVNINSMLFMDGADFTGMTVERNDNYDDGTYWYEDMTEDKMITVVSRCVPTDPAWMENGDLADAPGEFIKPIVHTAISAEAYDFEAESAADQTTVKNGFPTLYSKWCIGKNEDTKQCDGVIVVTDQYTYLYYFSTSADHYEEMADTFRELLLRVQLVEAME